jgi:hypothetical protein
VIKEEMIMNCLRSLETHLEGLGIQVIEEDEALLITLPKINEEVKIQFEGQKMLIIKEYAVDKDPDLRGVPAMNHRVQQLCLEFWLFMGECHLNGFMLVNHLTSPPEVRVQFYFQGKKYIDFAEELTEEYIDPIMERELKEHSFFK